MTKKLFYDDLYQRQFDAVVMQQITLNGKNHVVLDQTAFYPGGGGQPCDLGTLNGDAVEDVYERNGDVFHVINGALPEGIVHGEIDWKRRFMLMQQHLGQHILSAVFVRDHGLDTVGLRIEQDMASIDLNGYVNTDQASLAEAVANEIIYQNIPLEVLFPDLEEIRRNSKRAVPQTDEAIRIVKIGELDYTPCCGLQNKNTGELGIIKIQHIDSHKSGSRIHFLCGRSALQWINAVCQNAVHLCRELNCCEDELAERVLKQRGEVQVLKAQQQGLLSRLSAAEAGELLKNAKSIGENAVVRHILTDTTQEEMKQLFTKLTEQKNAVILLGGQTADGAFLMFGCDKSEKHIDVRHAFQVALSMIDGKGGGAPCYAQGLGSNVSNLPNALDAAFQKIKNQLITK